MLRYNMFLQFLRTVPRNEQELGKVIEYLKCELNLILNIQTLVTNCCEKTTSTNKKATQERFLLIYLVIHLS